MTNKFRLSGFVAAVAATIGLGIGVGQAAPQQAQAAAPKANSYAWFAAKNYQGQQVITVNGNKVDFTRNELKNSGAWAKYGNLDKYNRATTAQASLNYKLMPKKEREPLYVDPTGWHNKKIGGGYLFNRSHLIGYQLTGQNNNPKNLITGTASLNAPSMERYENQVAGYMRQHHSSYIRYRVEPVFRGKELLARGVHMEAQSLGSNAVHFNVYIFNVQKGVSLNYNNGTSVVSKAAMATPTKTAVKKPAVKKAPVKKAATKKYVVKKTSAKKAPAKGVSDNTTVYIVGSGHVYHLNRNCVALKRSHNVMKMTLKQAKARGHYSKCKLEH